MTVRRVRTVINVCFAGITGWAAQPIVEAIGRTDDLVLTSGVSRSAAGQSLVEVTGKNWTGSVFATVAEALASAPTDVLVDFTGATAVKVNVWTAVEAEVHVVIGSSGLSAESYADLDRLSRNRGVGVIAAGNFSVMAAVLRRAAVMAAEHLARWEIIDYSSDAKSDVPSGTARDLAETLANIHDRKRPSGMPISTGRPKRAELRLRVPRSTRSGCPASWSAPRSCSEARANASQCVTMRGRPLTRT